MSDDADKATSLKHAAGSESDAWNTYIGAHALAAISPYAGGEEVRDKMRAIVVGFLRNLEDRKGRPARLVNEDALPDNCGVLPTPEQLFGDEALRGCAVDPGDTQPPPGAEQLGNLLEAKQGASSEISRWEARL
jgi:hypothetical protein